MRVKLTDRFVSTAKVTARTDYFDEANKGLALRVSEHGAKSWTFHFTDVAGKRVRLTLGTYPGMSLAAARAKVVEAKVNIADGKDPNPTKGDVGSMLDEFQARYADELRSADYVRDVIDRLVKPRDRRHRLARNSAFPCLGNARQDRGHERLGNG